MLGGLVHIYIALGPQLRELTNVRALERLIADQAISAGPTPG